MSIDAGSENREEYRQRYWDDVHSIFLSEYLLSNKSKRCFQYMKSLYFGEPLDPHEKSIQPFLARNGYGTIFRLMQEQTPSAWNRFFEVVPQEWSLNSYIDMQYRFSSMDSNISVDPTRAGWTGEDDLAYFTFWWGQQYDADNYEFMGQKHPHPYSASAACDEVTVGIRQTLSGVRHHQSKYVHLYDYWKSALIQMDSTIFYPESSLDDDYFKVATHIEKSRLKSIKQSVALMLKYVNNKDLTIQKFEKNRGVLNASTLTLQAYGMDVLSGEQLWELPNLVAFRNQIIDDMKKEELPDAILALNHWAKHPDADMENLWTQTLFGGSYEDPWNPKPKRMKRAAVKKASIQKVVVADSISSEMCAAVESVRQELLSIGVPTQFDKPIDKKAIEAMLKDRGLTGKHAVFQLNELAKSANRYDYFELLIPQLCVRIWREPFAGYEESEVNSVFKEAWQSVGNAIGSHCKVDAVRTRKKKIEDGIYDVDVTVTIGGEKYKYEYEVVDSNIDESIYDDFVDFRQAIELPWRFHFDRTFSESEVYVFYLPESASHLLLG